MKVTFAKGDETVRSLTVRVGDPAKYGSEVGLYAAAAMEVQTGTYDLSKEMRTALAGAVRNWIELRRVEIKGGG